MARGDSTGRAIAAVCALTSASRGLRASELAEAIGVTPRSAHRLLGVLQRSLPIGASASGKERRYKLEGWRIPPLQLTSGEVLALLWAERSAGAGLRETVIASPLRSAIAKLRALVPGDGFEKLAALAQAHLALPGAYHDYAARDVEIAALRRAIEEGVTVYMAYQGHRPREFDPYALVHNRGALYAVGFCHRRRDFVPFLVDRIRGIHLTRKPFERRRDFDPAVFFAGAWGVWRGKPETVRLRFVPELSRWAKEQRWPGQKGFTAHMDGSATLTLRLAVTPDLVAEILRHGARARVLAPKHLAETVAREHFAAAGSAARVAGEPLRPAAAGVRKLERAAGRRRASHG